jgi:hypothetical protein
VLLCCHRWFGLIKGTGVGRGRFAALRALVFFACSVLPSLAQEAQTSQAPTSMHRWLATYGGAVISLKDPKTGMLFYVESNGRTVVAFDNAGRVMWGIDVLEDSKIKPEPGQPLIRSLRLEGNYLWVTFGGTYRARIQTNTGKVQYAGPG